VCWRTEESKTTLSIPLVNCRMVDQDAPLYHPFLKVPCAQPLSQVPADAQQITDRSKCLPLNVYFIAASCLKARTIAIDRQKKFATDPARAFPEDLR
jgi:hypothetical protein